VYANIYTIYLIYTQYIHNIYTITRPDREETGKKMRKWEGEKMRKWENETGRRETSSLPQYDQIDFGIIDQSKQI
jgi:hypothetical protein